LKRWVRVSAGEVRVTLPPLVVGNGLGSMLWWVLKTLKSISVLNSGWAVVALSRCVPLHTIGLADGVDPNW